MPKEFAVSLARTLAAQFANEVPWTLTGEIDSDDAIGKVAAALRPTFAAREEALFEEISALSPDLGRKVSDFLGDTQAFAGDGGYLFGLAVGQHLRIPMLSSRERDIQRGKSRLVATGAMTKKAAAPKAKPARRPRP